MKKSSEYIGLVGWPLACFMAGAVGALVEPGMWYEALQKPAWTPPNWTFPVVWPILYVCMASSAWLVWKQAGFSGARDALTLFLVQLALNGLWSWLFLCSAPDRYRAGEIMLLWIMIPSVLWCFAHTANGQRSCWSLTWSGWRMPPP
ncbi:MAG: TspO/MBR family protein [Balneolaceae bacterium]|nr:TspO/MBR family protein [Balneolaceae bacterium]